MVVEDHQELVHMGLYVRHAESRHELPPVLSEQLLLQVLYLLKKIRNTVDKLSNTISAKNFTFSWDKL